MLFLNTVLYVSIPVAIILGLWVIPEADLGPIERVLVQLLGFVLCYIPFHLGRYWRKRRLNWATAAYLSANALRIGGIFVVMLVFHRYNPPKTILAIELYVITVASFLVFQLVALSLFRRHGNKG